MSAQPEYTNFKERLQALARRKGGSGVIKIILSKPYQARLKVVGADYVEFEEINDYGEAVATHLYPLREVRGLVVDSMEARRAELTRMFNMASEERQET